MLKYLSLLPLKIATGAALLLTLVPSSAKAAIIGYSYQEGDVTYNLSQEDVEFETFINDDYNFWYNSLNRSTSILGFDEEQDVVIPEYEDGRKVYHQRLNEWDNINLDDLLVLEPGMKVDSHLLYFVKPPEIPRNKVIYAEATVKFDSKIVGFIGDSRLFYDDNENFRYRDWYSFDSSGGSVSGDYVVGNDLFAPGYTHDPNYPGLWTLEEEGYGPLDKVEFLDESMTTIKLTWSLRGAIDPLRVITLTPIESNQPIQPVPEPLTLLGAGSAIAMGGFFKSKLKNKAKDA